MEYEHSDNTACKWVMSLSELANDIHLVVDLSSHTFLYASPLLQTVFGLEPGDLLGKANNAAISPHDSGEFGRALLQLTQQQHYNTELRLTDKHRNEHWLRLLAAPLHNSPEGPPLGGMTLRDITAEKQLEKRLRNELEIKDLLNEDLSNHREELKASLDDVRISNAQLQQSRNEIASIINSASEAICTLDAQGRIASMNPAGLQLFGQDPRLLPYQYLLNLVAQPFKKEVVGFLLGYHPPTGPAHTYRAEIDMVRGNRKETFPAQLSISQVDGNEQVRFIAVITDLTEMRRAQQELQEKQELVKKITNTIPDFIFVFDIESEKLVFFNEKISNILEYSSDDLQRYDLRRMARQIHPDDRPALEEVGRQVLYGQLGIGSVSCRVRAKNSKNYRWINLQYTAFANDAQGRTTRLLGVLRDISDIKKREEELEQARRDAEQAALAKSQFLSNMSHEIRTPLNGIMGMTHLLLDDHLQENQREKLRVIRFSADNLMAIINDILDYSKIEAGSVNLELIPFRLGEVLENIAMLLRPRAEEKGLKLEVDIAPNTPDWVVGDPHRLAQILTNLLGNAIKFTEHGWVKLSLDAHSRHGQTHEPLFTFRVSDTGIGIPAEKHEAIFERFTQASTDTTRRFGGTGLGLAIAKRLIELHHGHIRLASAPGKGSTFWFSIAYPQATKAQQESIPNQATLAKPNSLLAGKKILVAEDNEVNLLVLQQFLDKWQIDYQMARNGHETLQKLQNQPADLLLLDLHMPEMDGYETARAIRQLPPPLGQVPLVALTAEVNPETRANVAQAGMNGIVNKPFKPNELYDCLCLYLLPKGEQASEPSAKQVAAPARQALIDMSDIFKIHASAKSSDFLEQFISMSLDAFEKFPNEYSQAMSARNTKEVHLLTHKMASHLAMLHFEALREELKEGEKWLMTPPNEDTQRHLATVTRLCRQATDELKRIYEETTGKK